MFVREFKEHDQEVAEEIFALHWTDPEFLEELSSELRSYIKNAPAENRRFFVAEESDEIVGVAGLRELPEYLRPYTVTDKPVELYIIAAKYKRRGIGTKLKTKLTEEAQKLGFAEILLFSPHSHDESWGFHDMLGFERVGEVTPPDDEVGQVWRKGL